MANCRLIANIPGFFPVFDTGTPHANFTQLVYYSMFLWAYNFSESASVVSI